MNASKPDTPHLAGHNVATGCETPSFITENPRRILKDMPGEQHTNFLLDYTYCLTFVRTLVRFQTYAIHFAQTECGLNALQTLLGVPYLMNAEKQPSPEERIAKYLARLTDLKERSALREVLERDMLLELISVNHSRINEYPLLESQQHGIINMLCFRAASHPAHDLVKKYNSSFVHALSQYGKIDDTKEKDIFKSEIVNAETLILKYVQGTVYASSLVHDNMEEVLIILFGEDVVEKVERITKDFELGSPYWKELYNVFCSKYIDQRVKATLHSTEKQMTRDGANVVIHLPLDDVLSDLCPKTKPIQKTRVQANVETLSSDMQCRIRQRNVLELLLLVRDNLLKGCTPEILNFIALLVCLDPISEEISDIIRPPAENGNAPHLSDMEEAKRIFVKEQALALAVGAALSFDTVREDFQLALGNLSVSQREAARKRLSILDVESLRRTLYYVYETETANRLQMLMEGEGGRVALRTVRSRRVEADKISALQEHGLTKIKKNKIFCPDPAYPAMLLFKARTLNDIRQLLDVLQTDEGLALRILKLFENADMRVEFLILLNLDAIQKTTTNSKAKLAELLLKFGVGSKANGS